MIPLLLAFLCQQQPEAPPPSPEGDASLHLFVVVSHPDDEDHRSDLAREALLEAPESLRKRVEGWDGLDAYLTELEALRSQLEPYTVVSTYEAELPSDTPVPAWQLRRGREPVVIREDIFWCHTFLLRHLLYLKRLHEYDIKRPKWLGTTGSVSRWYEKKTNSSEFWDDGVSHKITYNYWRPVVEPFPAPNVTYGWSRYITEDGATLGDLCTSHPGSDLVEILEALDMGTGLMEPAIETERKRRTTEWLKETNFWVDSMNRRK